MTRLYTPRARRVHRTSNRSIKNWVKGAKKNPPSPEPEAAIPIASPRFFSNQCVGAAIAEK